MYKLNRENIHGVVALLLFSALFQVPVVRKTGGLADTVFDLDDQPNHEMANG